MRRAIVAVIWMVLAAPAFSQSSESAKGGDSKLGVGDTVHITVFQQADLSSDARISERGTVAMALLGEVKIAGLSQTDAAKLIATELKKGKYLNNPQVT